MIKYNKVKKIKNTINFKLKTKLKKKHGIKTSNYKLPYIIKSRTKTSETLRDVNPRISKTHLIKKVYDVECKDYKPIIDQTYRTYKRYKRRHQSYLVKKRGILQFLFPYVIEYGNVQSKYTTTKYYSNVNLVVPIIKNFHRINACYELPDHKLLESYHMSSNSFIFNKRKIERNIDSFSNYKLFYKEMSELLKEKKKLYYERLYRQKHIKIYTSLKDYYKMKHYKYPRYIWNLIFQDPVVEKFTNLFIKDGNKERAEKLVFRTILYFHNYLRENPFRIFRKAIQKVRPYVRSKKIPYGKKTKTVPHPIGQKQQIKIAMKWIKLEAHSIKSKCSFQFKLLHALHNAYSKKGQAYRNMLTMHSEAYAERAYMYSNYYLKSSKTNFKRKF